MIVRRIRPIFLGLWCWNATFKALSIRLLTVSSFGPSPRKLFSSSLVLLVLPRILLSARDISFGMYLSECLRYCLSFMVRNYILTPLGTKRCIRLIRWSLKTPNSACAIALSCSSCSLHPGSVGCIWRTARRTPSEDLQLVSWVCPYLSSLSRVPSWASQSRLLDILG